MPQLVTDVDGQRIHLLHAVRALTPLPLLLTHGWPGSVMEFLDVLGPLTEDFHVVAPSLRGSRSRARRASRAGTRAASPVPSRS